MRDQATGHHGCQGLFGLDNFSGADCGGKFIGITKKTWIDAYLKLDDVESKLGKIDFNKKSPTDIHTIPHHSHCGPVSHLLGATIASH